MAGGLFVPVAKFTELLFGLGDETPRTVGVDCERTFAGFGGCGTGFNM